MRHAEGSELLTSEPQQKRVRNGVVMRAEM